MYQIPVLLPLLMLTLLSIPGSGGSRFVSMGGKSWILEDTYVIIEQPKTNKTNIRM